MAYGKIEWVRLDELIPEAERLGLDRETVEEVVADNCSRYEWSGEQKVEGDWRYISRGLLNAITLELHLSKLT